MAKTVPLKIISKHKNNPIQIEALLLGQANLLNDNEINDKYYLLLQKEYQYLKKLYQLQPQTILALMGKSRPSNFPTIRLAQLAALLVNKKHLFRQILETESIKEMADLWKTQPNDFWLYHYTFNQVSEQSEKKLGESLFQILMINTITPFVYAYGVSTNNKEYISKAALWWQTIAAEKNSIIKSFNQLGIKATNAFESQSLLYLKKNYCDPKKCLQCSWGNSFFKPKKIID